MVISFLAPELSATVSIVCIWIMAASSRSPLDDLGDSPPLVSRQRATLGDLHLVTDLAFVRLVVGHELPRLHHETVVELVLHQAIHLDGHGLVHGSRNHSADLAALSADHVLLHGLLRF